MVSVDERENWRKQENFMSVLEFRCHVQLNATPQFRMANIPSLNIYAHLSHSREDSGS